MGGLTARGLHGRLEADFASTYDGHVSARVQSEAPLELRGPFRRDGRSLYLLRNTTAGMLDGDRYEVRLAVEGGATVQVASSSAARAFAMPAGEASASVELRVEGGGGLVWGPHVTILQTGSRLRQETRVVVEDEGSALLADVLVLGRLARGERYDFAAYESTLTVSIGDGKTLYEESYRLQPGPELDASLAGRGVLTSLYLIGEGAGDKAHAIEAASACWPLLAGWSRLPNEAGLVVRSLAESLSDGLRFAEGLIEVLAPAQALRSSMVARSFTDLPMAVS